MLYLVIDSVVNIPNIVIVAYKIMVVADERAHNPLTAIFTHCISLCLHKRTTMKKILFVDRIYSHAIVAHVHSKTDRVQVFAIQHFNNLSNPNFPFLHDLRKRSYLLNRLSERGGSAAKRMEI
jgi:hypothetical protein